jgi:hypothetical protein
MLHTLSLLRCSFMIKRLTPTHLMFLLGVLLVRHTYAQSSVALQGSSLVKATSTQAVFSYPAPPDGSVCQWQVSTSPLMRPLVLDVDTAVFTGADLDNRAGSQTGAIRFFVVGTRVVEKGLDGKAYSRALPANTTLYYKNSCWDSGTFTTANIPFGSSYADPLQLDSSGYITPFIDPNDRTQQIVDSQTGAVLRRVTTASDGFTTIGWPAGGADDLCGSRLVNGGYHCGIWTDLGTLLYWDRSDDRGIALSGENDAPTNCVVIFSPILLDLCVPFLGS